MMASPHTPLVFTPTTPIGSSSSSSSTFSNIKKCTNNDDINSSTIMNNINCQSLSTSTTTTTTSSISLNNAIASSSSSSAMFRITKFDDDNNNNNNNNQNNMNDGIKLTTSSPSLALPKSTSILVAVTITNNNNKNPITMNGNNGIIIPNNGHVSDSKSIAGDNIIIKNDKPPLTSHHHLPPLSSSSSSSQPPIITIIDENSNMSIKSSSSSSSASSSVDNSPKRKRRRGEDQRLMDDLHKIDSSLAAKVTRMIESEQQQQQQNGTNGLIENPIKMIKNDKLSSLLDECDQQQQKSSTNNTKSSSSSSGDCPALHLRPRRNIRPNPFTTAGYLSSSGSSSPIFLSPIKCSTNTNQSPRNFLKTQNLLMDTTKQLNKFLNNSVKREPSDDGDDVKPSINMTTDKQNDSNIDMKKSSCIQRRRKIIPIDRYVRRDLDVSVFATMITPARLEISQTYPYNYLSLKILEQKSIRFVELNDSRTKRQFTCPILELIAVDIPDRFNIDYINGVFDEPEVNSVSATKLTVYLVGSYALKSKSLITMNDKSSANDGYKSEKIINILKFRTSHEKLPSPITRNLKKRKLIHGNRTPEYPFTIIVDSPDDLMENFIMKNEQIKSENNDNDDDDDEVIILDDPFVDLYNNQNNNDDDDWLPMVSYSEQWQPPKDPRELNRSLYIIQPCIPKFESSSRTVKMSSSSPSTIMA